MSFEQARAAIRAVLDARGAHWVEPPLLQPAAIYLELYGEQIRRRVFLIEDAGRGMCLRPRPYRAGSAGGVRAEQDAGSGCI